MEIPLLIQVFHHLLFTDSCINACVNVENVKKVNVDVSKVFKKVSHRIDHSHFVVNKIFY